jgi:competence protein ComEC
MDAMRTALLKPHFFMRWRTFPALITAFLFALGIFIGRWFPIFSFFDWICVWSFVGFVYWANSVYRGGRLVNLQPILRSISLVALILIFGSLRQSMEQDLPPHHVTNLTTDRPETHVFQGRIVDFPTKTRYGMRFLLDADRWDKNASQYPVTGLIQVMLKLPPEVTELPPLELGDEITISGDLQAPRGKRNPADFDYRAYLANKHIFSTLYVREVGTLHLVAHQQTWAEQFILPIRAYIQRSIQQVIHNSEAKAVMVALILGDQSELDTETRADFSQTGLTHILAISGLHILLIGMLLYNLLRPMLRRLNRFSWQTEEWIRAVLTLFVLLVYTALTGATPSVVRAVVMCAVFIGGNLFQRNSSALNSLGASALVLLLLNPSYLFDIGFQLSYAAVAGILLLNPLSKLWLDALTATWKPKEWLKNYLIEPLLVSFYATLATMPVLLYHFGQVSFAGLVLNLIAIPSSSAALIAGLLSLLFQGWLPFVGESFGAVAEVCTWILLKTASLGNSYFSWTTLHVFVDNLWVLFALIAAIFMLAQWQTVIRWKVGILSLSCLSLGVWTSNFDGSNLPKLDILYFDVGQGDAALVTFPNGKTLLVDTGNASDFRDEGLSTIYPHLKRYGISSLDAVLITHPHNDHQGGLPSLMRHLVIRSVITNGQPYDSPAYHETLKLVDSLHVAYLTAKAGSRLILDPTVTAEVLSPSYTPNAQSEVNNASLVLRLKYGNTSFLFLGDADAKAESNLVDRYGSSLSADVVKVGHHGSRTSSIPAFVLASGKKTGFSVVSVAQKNRYGLPDEEIVARWKQRTHLIQTAWDQAVWFSSDGFKVFPKVWKRTE